ncbi:F0F1 ATP synthase subunit delta [Brevibacterium album]|uniref:F0F1 ATP synthase subunit delta n=1 Tax=Brevibacterium album TaxID=417948 RepID=UPI000420783E|nr:F0F1 ATP synthase subunit delta [Brevibacterium album]
MLQSSRMSLQQVREQVDAQVSASAETAGRLGSDLLSIVSVLAGDVSLRKALADAANDAGAKRALVEGLFAGRVDDRAIAVTAAAAGQRWARPQDFVSAVEIAGVTAVAAAAQAASRLGRVEEELFRFARTIEAEHELALALGSPAPAEDKRTLVADLLGAKAAEETVVLATQAAGQPRGLRVSEALDRYGEVLAARQNRSVAEVVVARPLTSAQQDRLASALSRTYGRELQLNLVVDPEVVGGVRVQVGDEVVSGTIADRLSDVRRRLAG